MFLSRVQVSAGNSRNTTEYGLQLKYLAGTPVTGRVAVVVGCGGLWWARFPEI